MAAQTHTLENPTNPNAFITIQQDSAIPPPLPPTSVTSPSHEFSFNSTYTINCNDMDIATFPVDFSPADDIFFDGQLLPLHPTVPHCLSEDICIENIRLSVDNECDLKCNTENTIVDNDSTRIETKESTKVKSSLASLILGLVKIKKLYRGSSVRDHKDGDDDRRSIYRKGFDVKRFVKGYLQMIQDMIVGFRKSTEKAKRELRRMPYSFPGQSNIRNSDGHRRKRKGHFSTPMSTRTSPSNSGILSSTSGPFSTTDDSTMEELKSAIQAAIAHCKNSVAVKEQLGKR